ncbi:MAG: hypothetical protein GSR84_00020 [Desulfurococcales archaeon]|nr:hypothetical protein [Desulfurococcales archaeon]
MASRGGIILLTLFILTLATPALLGVAQPSGEEARQKFEQLGCTGCHNGGVAPAWDDVVALFQEWKTKYGSLDEAVSSEVNYFGKTFNSYDEMMAEMAKSSAAGTIDNPDFQIIYQYLKSIYEGGQAGGQETTQQTQTQAPAEETQTTQPEETQAGGGEEAAETTTETPGPVLGFGQIVGIAIVILVIIVGIAYFVARK